MMESGLLSTARRDIEAWLGTVGRMMFNERDLQVHLAQRLLGTGNYDDVEVEYYVPREELAGYPWPNELRIDIVLVKGGEYLPVELKYKTGRVSTRLRRFGEMLGACEVIKEQGARDLGMYDFWKDVKRLEMLKARFATVKGGLALFVTNDRGYMAPVRKGALHVAFAMEAGVHSRLKSWPRRSRTTNGRPDFELERDYAVEWRHMVMGGEEFHATMVEV